MSKESTVQHYRPERLTSSLSVVKDGRLVSGVLAKGAGCPRDAPRVPADLPADDAALSSALCARRMESAVESTTCRPRQKY